jgi:hypothetical protein
MAPGDHGRDLLSVAPLVVTVPPICPEMLVTELADLFTREEEIEAYPVVREGRPVGLITRARLSRTLFTRYGYALFCRRSVSQMGLGRFLAVQVEDPLDSVPGRSLARENEDLYDDLLVVDGAIAT